MVTTTRTFTHILNRRSWCAWCVLFLSLSSALLLPLLWTPLMGVVTENTADAPAAHHPAMSSPTYTWTSLPDPAGSLNQLLWETPATLNHSWNFSVLLILFSLSHLRLPALRLNPVCLPASPALSLEPEHNRHSLTPQERLLHKPQPHLCKFSINSLVFNINPCLHLSPWSPDLTETHTLIVA